MKNRRAAFTLIELLCVIAIIAMLASMLTPVFGDIRKKADSTTCSNNLRQIGVSVSLYLNDHDYTYPYVQPNPNQPLSAPEYADAKGMLDTFSAYGVTDKILQCPADIKDPNFNYYGETGSSYLWNPLLDGDVKTNPLIYGRRGAFTANSLARLRQVTDAYPAHRNHSNALYADGHVVSY